MITRYITFWRIHVRHYNVRDKDAFSTDIMNVIKSSLKEKDQKHLNRDQTKSVSKTKLFGANFMQNGP